MKRISLPENYNYIACFLTLRCNYHCHFCLNRFTPLEKSTNEISGGYLIKADGGFQPEADPPLAEMPVSAPLEKNFLTGSAYTGRGPGTLSGFNGLKIKGQELSGENWVAGLNRLELRGDLPVTLEGGEPSLHQDFIYIINHLRPDIKIDILTNLNFDLDEFMSSVKPERLNREAPYAPIRVSYYPEIISLKEISEKILKLMKAGFKVGLYGIRHPEWERYNREAKKTCQKLGIDFRIKEFLGFYQGKLYGTYRYPDACQLKKVETKLCRINELIIDPGGDIYRCHSDLYAGRVPIANLLDESLSIKYDFRSCDWYGFCHPCDIKIKTNRFQQFGHISVEIGAGDKATQPTPALLGKEVNIHQWKFTPHHRKPRL